MNHSCCVTHAKNVSTRMEKQAFLWKQMLLIVFKRHQQSKSWTHISYMWWGVKCETMRSLAVRVEYGEGITCAKSKQRPHSSLKPDITDAKGIAHHRTTNPITLGAGKVSWLKFWQNKTSFVRSLFTGLSPRQKSIPHDAFIVFSQTHTRPHICRHGYCTTIIAAKNSWKTTANMWWMLWNVALWTA